MSVKPIPDGYRNITPYLSIEGAAAAVDFYQQAFGATELFRMPTPSGGIGHAEIKIGDSTIMLADPCEEETFRNPRSLGGSPAGLHLYVEDVDTVFAQAVAAGAKIIQPLENRFYDDRNGTLEDPFGHLWFLSTHKEDLTPEEIDKRAKEFFAKKDA